MSDDPHAYNLCERSLTQGWLTSHVWVPLARRLPARLHPNAITALGAMAMLASLASAWFALGGQRWGYLGAALCAALYFIADNVDGLHARRTGQTSRLGEFLDHWLDTINGAALTLPVALCLGLRGGLLLLVGASVALAYFATIWEQHHDGVFHSGRLGANEAIIAVIGLYVLLFTCPGASWLSYAPRTVNLAVAVAILSVLVSLVTVLKSLRRCRGPLKDFAPLALVIGATLALGGAGMVSDRLAVVWIMAANVLFSGALLIGRLTGRRSRFRGTVASAASVLVLMVGVARPGPLDQVLGISAVPIAASLLMLLVIVWDLARTTASLRR